MEKIYNYKTKQLEEFPEKVPTVEGYLKSGIYFKKASDIELGKEKGISWWSLYPSLGRFEYRFDSIAEELQLLPLFTVKVEIDAENFYYRYEDYGFKSLKDVIVWIYLHNEHDFSEKDMAYAFGKRKYGDELISL